MLREYMNAMQVPVCWDSDVEDIDREREREGASGRGVNNREMAYK